MSAASAPDKGMFTRIPVGRCLYNGLDNLPAWVAKRRPFKAKERKVFHHGSIKLR